jgi:hypothetical protein
MRHITMIIIVMLVWCQQLMQNNNTYG